MTLKLSLPLISSSVHRLHSPPLPLLTILSSLSSTISSLAVINVIKLIELRWIGRGLRSETMSWACQNRDVGESEKSCLKTQGLGLGFNF